MSERPERTNGPIRLALVDDYDVVVIGIANMLDPYRDRVLICELDANAPLIDTVDIALYDSFAQPEADQSDVGVLIESPRAHKVVVYTWNFDPELIASARRKLTRDDNCSATPWATS